MNKYIKNMIRMMPVASVSMSFAFDASAAQSSARKVNPTINKIKRYNKIVYIALLAIMSVCLLLGYVPGCEAAASWVTPPVALFLT